MCLDTPLKRVEAFSEVVSERVVERIGPVYKLLLNLIFSKKNIIVEGVEPRTRDLAAEW